jgi:hypothetical protein
VSAGVHTRATTRALYPTALVGLLAGNSDVVYTLKNAPLAQLDRASGYEPEGREFESLRAHHLFYQLHLFNHFQPYSYLKATIGSTRMAHRAGI